MEILEDIERAAWDCPRRKWRGPFCRGVQVLEAIWRYKERGRVPLTAEDLGLGPRHVPFLLQLQKLGPEAPFEEAALQLLPILYKAHRLQVWLELGRMLGVYGR